MCVGHLGEFRWRDLSAQHIRDGCLQLVTAMIITWNTAYLSAAADKLCAEGVQVTDEQLAYILPLRSMNEVVEQLELGI